MEKSLTIGCVFPFLRTYAKLLFSEDWQEKKNWSLPTTPIATDIINVFQTQFATYWKSIPAKSIGLATVLDPRYKGMTIFDEPEKKLIQQILIQDIETLQRTNHIGISDNTVDPLSLMLSYLSLEVSSSTNDVMLWWKRNHQKLNELTYYFRMYYCIPCIANVRENALYGSVDKFYSKRYCLEDSLAEAYIMIRSNYKYINNE